MAVVRRKSVKKVGVKLITPERIVEILIKGGYNKTTAKKLVSKHYDTVRRIWPGATARKVAEICSSLY